MRTLLWNLVLALAWTAATGPSVRSFLVGFGLGYLILWMSPSEGPRTRYFLKVAQLAGFLGFFLKELVVATLRLAYDVLTPSHHMDAAVLGIPLELQTPGGITLLAIVVSLTPGTLALDVSTDRRILYIHAMYATDPDAVRHSIKEGFERRILELLR